MKSKFPTLFGLQQAVQCAQLLVHGADSTKEDSVKEARECLRKAKENLRVFVYRQKGSVTKSGKSLRI